MKCPIPYVNLQMDSFPPTYERNDCLKENCHWWSQKYDRCAILGYLGALDSLADTLRKIESKIPLGGAR